MSRNEGGYLGNRPSFAANVLPGIWTLQEVYDRTRYSNWYTNSYYYQQSTVGHHQIVLTQEVPYLDITLRGGAGGSDNNLSDNNASPCSSDSGYYGKGGFGGIVSFRYQPSTPFQPGDYISFIVGDIGTHSNSGTSSSQLKQQPSAYQGGAGGCVGGGATWLMFGQYTETQMKNSGNESAIIAVAGGGGGAGRRGGDANTVNCGGDGGNANISSLVSSSTHYWGYGQGGVPGRHASNTQTTRGSDGDINGGGDGAPGYYSGGGGGGGGRGGGGAGSTCSYCGNSGGAGGNIGGSGSSAPYGSNGGTYLEGGEVGSSGYGGGGGQGLWGGGAGSVGNGSGHAGGGGGGAGSSYIKVTSLISNASFTTHNNRNNSGLLTLEYP